MKAIHNTPTPNGSETKVGNYKLKYNFESNSQLAVVFVSIYKVGNYKLKYNFESNSQHIFIPNNAKVGWEL